MKHAPLLTLWSICLAPFALISATHVQSQPAARDATTPAPNAPPGMIRVCAPGDFHDCGIWTWNNGHYDGVWKDVRVTAALTVVSFSRDSVVIERVDYGRTAGRYVYQGTISAQGNSILNGEWTDRYSGAHGVFTATWGDAAAMANMREDTQDSVRQYFDLHILDKCLHFKTAQEEASFRTGELQDRDYIESQLALNTREGTTRATRHLAFYLLNVSMHGDRACLNAQLPGP
jgi:hypothetical protein